MNRSADKIRDSLLAARRFGLNYPIGSSERSKLQNWPSDRGKCGAQYGDQPKGAAARWRK